MLVLILFLCGCDLYVTKQPWSENSKWICTEPLIFYEISDEFPCGIANVEINGETILFEIDYLSSVARAFEYNEADPNSKTNDLFTGKCKYSKNEFTIIINKDSDVLFNGKYETLVFRKVSRFSMESIQLQ